MMTILTIVLIANVLGYTYDSAGRWPSTDFYPARPSGNLTVFPHIFELELCL